MTNIHFFIISRSFLLRMRIVSAKSCIENQNTHFVFSNFLFFFFSKIVPCMRYAEKYCTAGNDTDDNMAHAHCMPDTQGYKYTHSGCVICDLCVIHIAWPRQWLHERASVLRNTYIACLVLIGFKASPDNIKPTKDRHH